MATGQGLPIGLHPFHRAEVSVFIPVDLFGGGKDGDLAPRAARNQRKAAGQADRRGVTEPAASIRHFI